MTLTLSRKSLKRYSWISYPILVAMLILFSINSLLGAQNQAWFGLLQKQQKISKDRETVARLNTKLAVIKSVDVKKTGDDLAWMLSVLPGSARITDVANQLRFAANNSGSVLVGYHSVQIAAAADFNLSVEYLVPDFQSGQKLLATLEGSFPLLKITDVTLQAPKMTLSVVSAWKQPQSVSVAIDDPLPTYDVSLLSLKSLLANYLTPVAPEVSTESASLDQLANPFESQ